LEKSKSTGLCRKKRAGCVGKQEVWEFTVFWLAGMKGRKGMLMARATIKITAIHPGKAKKSCKNI